MKRVIQVVTAILIVLTALFSGLYLKFNTEPYITLAVTFGTTLYHFAMRLIVGVLVPRSFKYTDSFLLKSHLKKISTSF